MHEDKTWREYLGTIITNAKEKQRIVEELGIQPITLNRWISGESEPRPHNLRRLLTILPHHRDQLIELIKKEKGFEEFSNLASEDVQNEISSEFYSKIFVTLASSTHNLRIWSICSLILQEALDQLDTERLGMAIWIVRCMPPSGPDCKVRSLRETIGLGTSPWSGHLEQKAMFLGAESLAGNVVSLCRPSVIENLDEEHNLMPASRVDDEKSAAIYPILYTGRIAGVLMVSSTQYNYFLSQSRATLLQQYADLAALAFEPEDFYASEDISLCVMPSHEEQKPAFANFRQRVADIMIDAANRNERLSNVQADLLVWHQLEEELLRIPVQRRGR
jgi:transcriptional regulator with XRE-family HTH domain